jgi:hypothetical protein
MSTRVLGLAVCLFAVAWLASAGLLAQAQAPARASSEAGDASYAMPRTPWGDPDLQGVWDYRSITPLERPAGLGEFFTDEQIAQREAVAARRMDEPPDENTPANLVHAQYMTDPGRFVDESRRTSLIIDPPDGRVPALTDEARERQAAGRRGGGGGGPARPGGRADSWLDRSPLERCITWGLPTALLPGLYNNNIRIAQAPGVVTIVHEMVHDARIVPLDGRPFSGQRNWLGESRGRWEGDTLVVETRNFNGKTSYRGSSVNLRLTERYTRLDDDRIDFRLTIEDDTHWTRPWTVALSMRPAEGEMFEYACHEGNYGLRNILENARDEERAAAAAAGSGN